MTINSREIKLILFLIIIVIGALSFFLYIQPTLEESRVIEDEIAALTTRKEQLTRWAADANGYREEIEATVEKEQEFFSRYPTELLQEDSLLFMAEAERVVPIGLYQVGFGEDVAAQITSEAEAQAIEEVEEATGMEDSTPEVIRDTTETTSLGNGLQSITTTTRFTFTARYDDFKEFLEYILTYKDRMVIYDISVSYGSDMDLVSGNFTLNQYALTGPDRDPLTVTRPSISQGTTNIFMSAAGNAGTASEAAPADFFIMLSPPEAATEAKIVGRANDASQDSYLINDDNSEQEITVTFEGEDGSYTADYSIGRESYEGEPIEFSKTGPIYLDIRSSPRAEDRDDVATSLNIVNRTDQTVFYSILNDDEEDSRVNIMGITGAVMAR